MLAQQYVRLYRNNSILTAGPGQLVLMMYEGALNSLALAREAFGRPATDFRRIEVIHRNIVKAQRIIGELNGTLNFDAGGDFAPLMRRLYEYYNRRLHEANMRKDVEALKEVEGLLGQIRDAWAEMLRRQNEGDGAADLAMAGSAQASLS